MLKSLCLCLVWAGLVKQKRKRQRGEAGGRRGTKENKKRHEPNCCRNACPLISPSLLPCWHAAAFLCLTHTGKVGAKVRRGRWAWGEFSPATGTLASLAQKWHHRPAAPPAPRGGASRPATDLVSSSLGQNKNSSVQIVPTTSTNNVTMAHFCLQKHAASLTQYNRRPRIVFALADCCCFFERRVLHFDA
jgi:hypothetical protein